MFGLMEFRPGTPTQLPKQHQRLHYCGVCKAMGRMYGQRTRLALNYDAIYLAELLTFIGEGQIDYKANWSPALLSYNCLRLPKEEALPFSLQYAASVNVLFTGIKLRDNVQDKGTFIWRTADKLMAPRVEQAEAQLRHWGLDLEKVDQWLREHAKREQAPARKKGNDYLHHLAEATAQITGMIFHQGAVQAGRPELAPKMGLLGQDFGKLIYLLDAYRDYKQDQRKNEFNPIAQAWGLQDSTLPEREQEKVQDLILRTGQHLIQSQRSLDLNPATLQFFQDRIESNLEEQLGLSRAEVQSCTTSPTAEPKRKISFNNRWQFIRNVTQAWESPKIWKRNAGWRTAGAIGLMAVLALLFPSFLHARADWFTHIDPEFLDRFGDLHPDWIPNEPEAACGDNCDCCDNGKCKCCDSNGGCKCNCNSSKCERDCECFLFSVLGTALLAILMIIGAVILIVRYSNRKERDRRAQFQQQQQPGYAPPRGPAPQEPGTFTQVVHRTGKSEETLMASAHDWFTHHFPNSLPQLNKNESYSTLSTREEFEIKGKNKANGQTLSFGKIRFLVQVHLKDGSASLQLKYFEHIGNGEIPAGGPLVLPQPQNSHEVLNPKGWKFLRDESAKKAQKLLDDFNQRI